MSSLPLTKKPEWSGENRERLEAFFSSPTGVRFLELLKFHQPAVRVVSDVNTTALSGAVHSGYAHAIDVINSLLHPEEAEADKAQDSFPSLDDDEGWPEPLKLKK